MSDTCYCQFCGQQIEKQSAKEMFFPEKMMYVKLCTACVDKHKNKVEKPKKNNLKKAYAAAHHKLK